MLRRILDEVPSLKAPGIIWRTVFNGDQHELFLRTWLIPLSQRPHSHACNRCGGLHKIVFHSAEDIVSVPPSDSYCERKMLKPEEACVYEFNERKFAEQLCKAFSVEQDFASYEKSGLLRVGWVGGPLRQYPVFLQLRNPQNAAGISRNLLLEEESPFIFFANTDLPHLYPLFKKKTCSLFSLPRIAGLSASGLSVVLTGPELFAGFLRDAEDAIYVPAPGVKIVRDYERIIFPDEYEVILSRAPVRRSMVRFIHQWVLQKNNPVFNLHTVSAAHNERHPHHAWSSPRLRDDLFKRNESDFDRLFETLDAPNGKYRLKM